MGEYQIYPVDRTGALLYPNGYPDAQLTKWKQTLNDIAQSEMKLPYDSVNPWLGCGKHEIQLWRNGELLDWLVPTKLKTDGRILTITLSDFNWYLKHLVFGNANRTNYLTNPSFETDAVGSATVTGWTAVNCTSAIINSNYELGAKAVRLTNATSGGADAYLGQQYTHTAGPGEADYGIFTAWMFLENITDPPIDMRGLFLDLLNAGVSTGPTWFPMMVSTPTGLWTRWQAALSVPAGQTRTFDARLYCPNGSVVWDACSIVFEESVSAPYPMGADQANIAADILNYAQSKWSGFNFLNNCPVTGINRMLSYQFVDHRKLLDALQDFPKYSDGMDFGWEFQGAVSPGVGTQARVFHTYFPKKGTDQTAYPLVLNEGIQALDWEEDLDRAATSVMIMSDQAGPSREEGSYIDTTPLNGLLLELVEQAPEQSMLSQLDAIAHQRYNEVSGGVVVPTVTTYQGAYDYIGHIRVGDTVHCTFLANGAAAATNVAYRVIDTELDPKVDGVKLTLNKVT